MTPILRRNKIKFIKMQYFKVYKITHIGLKLFLENFRYADR